MTGHVVVRLSLVDRAGAESFCGAADRGRHRRSVARISCRWSRASILLATWLSIGFLAWRKKCDESLQQRHAPFSAPHDCAAPSSTRIAEEDFVREYSARVSKTVQAETASRDVSRARTKALPRDAACRQRCGTLCRGTSPELLLCHSGSAPSGALFASRPTSREASEGIGRLS